MPNPVAAQAFTLIFNVPESHVTACKAAILAAGAGRSPGGTYTERCWTALGTGQFRPGNMANPHIGSVGELESVPEVRVEAPCVGEDVVRRAVEALKIAHPYEEPSYKVIRVEDF